MDTEMAHDKAILQKWYLSITAKPSASDGYWYHGCTDKAIKFLDHTQHAEAEYRTPISSKQATREFVTALKTPPTRAQRNGIARLKAAWNSPYWSPDIALKSFFDLDAVYFGGHLRGECGLEWIGNIEEYMKDKPVNLPKNFYGITERYRSDNVFVSVRILLNAEKCLKNAKSIDEAKRWVIGTLLHEMIHAYDAVRCTGHPGDDLTKEASSDLDSFGHGPNFQRSAFVLGLLRTIDDFGFDVMWNHELDEELEPSDEERQGDDASNPIELD